MTLATRDCANKSEAVMQAGRNFDEILGVTKALQLSEKHEISTPVTGTAVTTFIAGSVTDEEAKTIYPEGWRAAKPYLPMVPAPKS